jgi:hypothetical protein
MDPIQRTVAIPPRKIIMQRAARRKVFWNIAPLAPSAEDIHHAIHDRPHVRPARAAAAFGGRDQRLDIRPFVIGQVARISQVIAATSPGSCPSTLEAPLESRIKKASVESK